MNAQSLARWVLALSLVVIPLSREMLYAAEPSTVCGNNTIVYTPDNVKIYGVEPDSEDVKEIFSTFNDLVQASNQHSLEGILKHYNPQFISGDNLTLAQIKNLITETWESYPDICYDSQPVELRVKGDWAAMETLDRSVATAPADEDIMNSPGKMSSQSKSVLVFRKLGKIWEITSDATIWEEATIRYGIADNLKVTLSTPEQVKGGNPYTATVWADVPEGTFSIVSIDNQVISYPHEKVDDKFRALGAPSNELQRVLTANSKNMNEIVTASLGLTNVYQSTTDRPSLALNGIITLVKRVNVVPVSAEEVLGYQDTQKQVKTSASGAVDLTVNPPKVESQQPQSFLDAPAMEEQETAPPASEEDELPSDEEQ